MTKQGIDSLMRITLSIGWSPPCIHPDDDDDDFHPFDFNYPPFALNLTRMFQWRCKRTYDVVRKSLHGFKRRWSLEEEQFFRNQVLGGRHFEVRTENRMQSGQATVWNSCLQNTFRLAKEIFSPSFKTLCCLVRRKLFVQLHLQRYSFNDTLTNT